MTRETVFELAAETKLDCTRASLPAGELAAMDELFISSTAGGLMPVSKVDGQPIGASSVGPVTTRLRDLYWSTPCRLVRDAGRIPHGERLYADRRMVV